MMVSGTRCTVLVDDRSGWESQSGKACEESIGDEWKDVVNMHS